MLIKKLLLLCCFAQFFFCPSISCSSCSATDSGEPTLEQMIGSMLMLGFRGLELKQGDAFLAQVAAGHVGHVILFDKDLPSNGKVPRNIKSRAQVTKLTKTLRSAAPLPMLIAVDQEGGQICRLKPGYGFLFAPAARAQGQGTPAETQELARKMGLDMAGVGINVDFAPVADVDANTNSPAIGKLGRSYSADHGQVALHVLAFGRGLAQAGVIPVLKHFPGHGCAGEDSHLGLTDITQCFAGERDLYPYGEAFRAGWPGMVMVGHLFHAGLDPKYPASLSKMVVTGLLRQGLGWQGVVVSDDLQMRAITGKYSLEESIFLAVDAGVDLLVFGNNLSWDALLPAKAFNTLYNLVKKGRISEARIKASWQRINSLVGTKH